MKLFLTFCLKSYIVGADGCRVTEGDTALNGVYACGWCATGATGVIVDTQVGSKTCAKVVAEDVRSGRYECVYSLLQKLLDTGRVTVAPESTERGLDALRALLMERAQHYTDWPHWLHIDDVERQRGASAGKPREKFTTLDELLNK